MDGRDKSFCNNQNFDCLLIRMEMDPNDIDRSQIAVLTEIELLKRQELREADLARAVAQLEIEYWKHLDRGDRESRDTGAFRIPSETGKEGTAMCPT